MKSTLTTLTSFCAILCVSVNSYAQVANYAFSQSMGTYTTITANTTPVVAGTSNPVWSGTAGATTRIDNIGLPFNICVNGVSNINRVSMHSNGYIQFSSAISPTSVTTPISSLNNVVSAFGADLEAKGTSSMGARLSGIQIGSAPFRYLTFQWGYASLASAMWRRVGFTNDFLHFQIVLYETTNVIETRYYITTAAAGAVTGVEVGLRGSSAADYNNRRMTTNGLWLNNNVAGIATSSTMNFGNGTVTKPDHNATGQQCLIFRWTPQYDPVGSPNMTACYYSPLPVELSEFNGEALEKMNKLSWITNTEHNSDYFIVEHSLNGGEWNYVGRVKSAGNSTSTVNYELEDRAFQAGTYNFYRLKQVDIDGKTKTYNMIYVDNRDAKKDLVKTVNLMGQEVGPFYQGMVIDVYSDGTTEKYYKQ